MPVVVKAITHRPFIRSFVPGKAVTWTHVPELAAVAVDPSLALGDLFLFRPGWMLHAVADLASITLPVVWCRGPGKPRPVHYLNLAAPYYHPDRGWLASAADAPMWDYEEDADAAVRNAVAGSVGGALRFLGVHLAAVDLTQELLARAAVG